MALKPQDIERVGRMLSENYGIRVVCRGDKCRTDGKTIWLPSLPKHVDNPRLLGLMRSYLDHEVGHLVGKSDSTLKAQVHDQHGNAGGYVLNALEDVRIEQVMSDMWAGCEANLRIGSSEVFKRLEQVASGGGEEAEALQQPLKQLTAALYARGKGFNTPSWIDPQIGQMVDQVDQKHSLGELSLWAKRTKDLMPVVEDIMAMLQQDQEQQQGDGQDDGDEGQPQAGDGQQQGQPGEGSQGEGQGQAGEQPESGDEGQPQAGGANGQDEQQSSEAGSEGEQQDADESSQGEGSGGEAEQPEAKDEAEGDGEAGEQQAQADASSGDGPTGDAEGSDEQGDDSASGAGGMAGFDPDAEGVDVGACLAEAAEGELEQELEQAEPAVAYRDYAPDMDSFVEVKGHHDPAFVEQSRRAGGPMRQRLAQLLQTEDRVWWRSGRRRGQPDPRSMAQLATGVANNVLRQRFEHKAPNTACYLMVDGSASMREAGYGSLLEQGDSNSKMHAACLAASAFAQVLDICKHPNAITAFVGQHCCKEYERDLARHELTRTYRPRNPSQNDGVRISAVEYATVKRWSEPFRMAQPKLSALASMAGGGTPLGEAIMFAIDELLVRREPRKVLMAFTDGQPNDAKLTMSACKYAERNGIEVVLIGILEDRVRGLHHRNAVCWSIDDLSKTTMAELTKALGH